MKCQKSPQFSFLILLEDVEMGFPNGSDGKEPTCRFHLQDALEKGMTTHSGILSWRIPWTEEPGGL